MGESVYLNDNAFVEAFLYEKKNGYFFKTTALSGATDGWRVVVLSVITITRWSGCGRLNVIGTKALILVRDRERDKKKDTQN